MYELIFDDKAVGHIEKLDIKSRERIINKIISTKNRPYRFFQKLTYREGYRLRVGNYRVIADIDEKSKKIIIIEMGHRKNIYGKLKRDYER